MPSLRQLLPAMYASDQTRPRLTFYDDAAGERIELSARVLGNWVAKAANLLQEEFDVAPGSVVRVDLPGHWRGVYWCLAAWELGATVALRDEADADIVVTTDAGLAAGSGDAVLVTLPMLARSSPVAAQAPSAVDEAKEISGYDDVCTPFGDVESLERTGFDAMVDESGTTVNSRDLVDAREGWGPATRVLVSGRLGEVMPVLLQAWAADGSGVLAEGEMRSGAVESERVTDDLRRPWRD